MAINDRLSTFNLMPMANSYLIYWLKMGRRGDKESVIQKFSLLLSQVASLLIQNFNFEFLIGNSVPEDRETFGGFYSLFILTPDITAPDDSTLTKYPVTFEN